MPKPIRKSPAGRIKRGTDEELPRAGHSRMCHPAMSIFPEARTAPNGKQVVQPTVEVDQIAFFCMDMFVIFKTLQLVVTWRACGTVHFNRGVKWEEPFGKRLARVSNPFESLRTRDAP